MSVKILRNGKELSLAVEFIHVMSKLSRLHVGVVGSRRRDCESLVRRLVNALPGDSVVVSGGCRGVDTWAKEAADNRGMDKSIHKPDLKGVKGYADAVKRYYARNKIVAAQSTVLFAFTAEDRTGGTENTIDYALEYGRVVYVIPATFNEEGFK